MRINLLQTMLATRYRAIDTRNSESSNPQMCMHMRHIYVRNESRELPRVDSPSFDEKGHIAHHAAIRNRCLRIDNIFAALV